MKRFLVMVVTLVMVAGGVWAQQGPGSGKGMRGGRQQMYDPAKAQTVSGEVTEVKEFASRNGVSKGIGLAVNTGSETLLVHIGPQFYLDKQSIKIGAGDRVEVVGVKTVRRGQDVMLAAEVKKGGDVLKLRDETGRPLWAGSGPGGGRQYQK